MTIEQQLLDLKGKSEKLNTLRIENSTKLKALEEEKEKLVLECQQLGIDPQKIEEVLNTEETALQNETSKLQQELDKVFDDLNAIQ